MKRDFNPVDVELSIENPSIERGAFYRLCFITESDIAPRTLKVTRLQDLLDNGYSRLDLVYNFCVGVFSQQGMDTVYIRAKRSYESYVDAYNSDDNSMYYFVVLQTKDLTEVQKFNSYLVSSDEMKLQFFSQNVGSKILKSPKLVNYYQDYALSGGASVDSKDFYLNKAYSGVTVVNKLPLPDYLLGGYGNTAVDYGVRMMVGKDYIWEIDKPNRQIRYARSVIESGWVGSREESTVNNSEVTVVATKGSNGKLNRASIIDPKVNIETISRELLKGLGKEALDYAMPLIDPEAKDWVLDPANNAITYTVPDGVEKTVPIDTVAAKVISNADAGHLESKKFLKSIPLFAYLLTGSGTEAVNKAVLDIDPEATDWELDPANNSVRYKPSYDDTYGAPEQYIWKSQGVQGSDPLDAAQKGAWSNPAICKGKNVPCVVSDIAPHSGGNPNWLQFSVDGSAPEYIIVRSLNPDYIPDTDAEKSIPIDTVASKVISNAESGHTPSQEALRLSTVERVNIGEYDEALEAASTEIEPSWKYLPIYDVAVQVKRNSIAGHAESIEAVNNSLPFELPDSDTPWAYVPEETSVTGSTTTIKAKRTFENQKLKSSITVAASASKVGESLINGGGTSALGYAVPQLIGDGVDWVLDPANNRIKYYADNPPTDINDPLLQYYWKSQGIKATTPEAAALEGAISNSSICGTTACSIYPDPNRPITDDYFYYCAVKSGYLVGCGYQAQRSKNPAYDPNAESEREEKYLPLDVVAQKVISNAEAGHAPSQEAVKATALEGFAAGEHDAALDAAAVIDN